MTMAEMRPLKVYLFIIILFCLVAMTENTLTIRRATIDDRDAVLKINDNVYGGLDGLPYFYEKYFSSSDIMPAVMLYNNKIVSMH